jgi:O-acetylserine/cysteine efflux transporter
MTPADIGLSVAVQFLWGFGFVAAKPTLDHFPPLMLMGMMYVLTCLCFPLRLTRIRTPFLPLLLVTTFVTTVQGGLIFNALTLLPASISILLLQTQVPFAVLFAWLLAGERPNLVRFLGIVLAFAGVAVVAGAPSGTTSWWPVGSASWSFGQAAARRFGRDDGMTLTTGISAMAIPQVAILSALTEHGQIAALASATPYQWAQFLVFALGGFVLAYSIWYGLLSRYRVDQVTPFGLLMPPIGALGGFLYLGERASVTEILGGAVILAGLAIVIWGKTPARLRVG